MNKLKLLLLLLIPISIKAECSNQELTRYKTLSGYVDYYYEYDGNFNITVYNLSNELTVKYLNNGQLFTSPSRIGEIKINGVVPGTSVKLGLYPNRGECSDYRVQTIYVNLPYYNKYHNDEVCKNNDNVLCSKWANTNKYSHEQFVNEVKKTKKDDVIEETEPEKDKDNSSILGFIGDYYIIILLVIIGGGITGIYFLNKKDKFDF